MGKEAVSHRILNSPRSLTDQESRQIEKYVTKVWLPAAASVTSIRSYSTSSCIITNRGMARGIPTA